MPAEHAIAVDLAKVYLVDRDGRERFCTTLAWGDDVECIEVGDKRVKIAFTDYRTQSDGSIAPRRVEGVIRVRNGVAAEDVLALRAQDRVLHVDFVDVQQGDGSVIETPAGKVMLVDGGDTPMFARYLANRYRGSRAPSPKEIECIVVTHGDADHFAGLTEIHRSETNETARKRLFIHPHRVYHNGLVKRGETVGGRRLKETEMFGATAVKGGKLFVTELVADLLAVPDAAMNAPFRAWKRALAAWRQRGPVEVRRLRLGDHDAFDFLRAEGVDVKVLGPMVEQVDGVEALRFLGSPRSGPRVGHPTVEDDDDFRGHSASHTINGHSIVLRLTYGRFSLLFTGDLNEEASRRLASHADPDDPLTVRSEVLKVPHHGSADFSGGFLAAVAPVVSVISSGDDKKEYIHPRATIMGALGKHSRLDEPLIFVTELVAFFKSEGWVKPETARPQIEAALSARRRADLARRKTPFFAFSRTAYGIVKIRTDGERMLVYTNSGQADLKEAYAYAIDANGQAAPAAVRQL